MAFKIKEKAIGSRGGVANSSMFYSIYFLMEGSKRRSHYHSSSCWKDLSATHAGNTPHHRSTASKGFHPAAHHLFIGHGKSMLKMIGQANHQADRNSGPLPVWRIQTAELLLNCVPVNFFGQLIQSMTSVQNVLQAVSEQTVLRARFFLNRLY